MSIARILGSLSPIHIWLVTALKGGRSVGSDLYGNKYYRAAARSGYAHERRWVVYSGEAEPSLVPPEWHGWLHHQTDVIPASGTPSFRRPWQKPHRPNRSGTLAAWRPPGHMLSGGARPRVSADYDPWTPPPGGL